MQRKLPLHRCGRRRNCCLDFVQFIAGSWSRLRFSKYEECRFHVVFCVHQVSPSSILTNFAPRPIPAFCSIFVCACSCACAWVWTWFHQLREGNGGQPRCCRVLQDLLPFLHKGQDGFKRDRCQIRGEVPVCVSCFFLFVNPVLSNQAFSVAM